MSAAGTFYDGSYEFPVQHGPFVPSRDRDTLSQIYEAKFHQLAAKWRPLAIGTKAPVGAGGVLVEETTPTDSGIAGVIEWKRIFAVLPASRTETEDYLYNFQKIQAADIIELPVLVASAVEHDYFHTKSPLNIKLFAGFRLLKVANPIWQIGNYTTGDWRIVENSTLHRWRGDIWERKTRKVRLSDLVLALA